MSVATKATSVKQAWDTSDYMRIVDARVVGETLVVMFKDHTWAEVELDQFLSRHQGVRWDRMTFSHYTVIVPTDEGPVEIPWLSIRSLSDPAFAAHLDAVGKESAVRTGKLIRQWREERGLSIEDLALAAGLDAAVVSRVEQGAVTVAFSTLRQILAPLDRGLHDLAVPAELGESDADEETL